MVWMLLRASQDDVPEDGLCGVAACRAMAIVKEFHFAADFKGRFAKAGLSPLGLRQLGYMN